MKALLLAAAVAITSFAIPTAPASSQSITFSDRGVTVRDNDYRGHHRRDWRERRHYRERHAYDCRVKTVKTYRNGKVIVRQVRTCR